MSDQPSSLTSHTTAADLAPLPTELSPHLPAADAVERAIAPAAVAALTPRLAPAENIDSLWRIHEYVHEYIRFADTKAAAVIAFSGAVIGVIYSANDALTQPTVVDATYWPIRIAIAILFCSILAAAWTIHPRLWREYPAGVIFWGSVSTHKNGLAYLEALRNTNASFEEHLASQVFIVSSVCEEKYFWSSFSIVLSVVGALFGVLTILWAHA